MSALPTADETPEDDAETPVLVDQLRQVFRDVLNTEVPSPETDLIQSGLLDSLALVELLFAIEQRFGVDLALEELDVESFRTLDRLAGVIADQTGTPGAARS